MLQDRGDAHRRVSIGVNGAAPSAGVGQCSPGAGTVPRSAASRDSGPPGSAAGGSAGSMVTGIGPGASPVPGELNVPGPVSFDTAASTELAAGGGTAAGTPGSGVGSDGLLIAGSSLGCCWRRPCPARFSVLYCSLLYCSLLQ